MFERYDDTSKEVADAEFLNAEAAKLLSERTKLVASNRIANLPILELSNQMKPLTYADWKHDEKIDHPVMLVAFADNADEEPPPPNMPKPTVPMATTESVFDQLIVNQPNPAGFKFELKQSVFSNSKTPRPTLDNWSMPDKK